jgi:hypothetical protein
LIQLDIAQLDNLSIGRQRDFIARLDALLMPYSRAYAAMPDGPRQEALGGVVNACRQWGIREELNVGLFSLLALVCGVSAIRSPAAQAVLADESSSGSAKVYQLWHAQRQNAAYDEIFRKLEQV